MYNTFIAHINITQRHEIYKEAIISIVTAMTKLQTVQAAINTQSNHA